MSNLAKRMAKGAAWLILLKLCERGLGLVSTLVLVRMLLPTDFGLVAMAMSLVATIEMLNSFNFDLALIKNQSADRAHFDTAWTLNVAFASICSVLLVGLSLPAAYFFAEPRVTEVVCWLSIATLISGFENIGVVAFRRELRLDREFKFQVIKKVVALVFTMAFAFAFRNYYALLAGTIAGRVFGVTASYLMHPFRPKFSLAARHELLSFSKWLAANNVLAVLATRSGDFIVGRIAGAHVLGLYNVASEIANLPTTELVAPINRATYPGYAQLSGRIEQLRNNFLEIYGGIARLAIPAGVGIACLAEPITLFLLGHKWLEASPLIAVTAISGAIVALQSNIGPLMLSIGAARMLTLWTMLQIGLLIPTQIVLVALYGAVGAAVALLATNLALIPFTHVFVSRAIGVPLKDFAAALWPPLMAAGVMLASLTWFAPTVSGLSSVIVAGITLLFDVTFGALVYFATLLAFWFVVPQSNCLEARIIRYAQKLLRSLFGRRVEEFSRDRM